MKKECLSRSQCKEQDYIFKKMDSIAKLLDGNFPEKFEDRMFFQNVLDVGEIGEFGQAHIENITLEHDHKDCCKLSVYDCGDGDEKVFLLYKNGFVISDKKLDDKTKYDLVAEKLELLLSLTDDHLSGAMQRLSQEGMLCF